MTIPAWDVELGGKLIGRIVRRTADFPFIFGSFEATPDFAAHAPLFAEELRLMNEDRMDEWELAYDRIDDLGLRLIPTDGSEQIEELILHIEGDEAWFRA